MFVSVASDLPSLERFSQIKDAQSSQLLDDLGHPIGVLSQQNRVILTPGRDPADRQGGGDLDRGQALLLEQRHRRPRHRARVRPGRRCTKATCRAPRRSSSSSSRTPSRPSRTARSSRSSREAALAYQLSHKWSKDKIVTAYLNTIYFGNGAYGIEAAAQTYFGHDVNHEGCGMPGHELCVAAARSRGRPRCSPASSSRPSAYDPTTHPTAATRAPQHSSCARCSSRAT